MVIALITYQYPPDSGKSLSNEAMATELYVGDLR